jgi:hypothetical protein
MAASKLRIVSRGRSQRLRVGFERSGSAVVTLAACHGAGKLRVISPMAFPYESRCWIERNGASEFLVWACTAAAGKRCQ